MGLPGVKHYLNFRSDDTGRIRITEPKGFDGTLLNIKKGNNRLGRDFFFNDGNATFIFEEDARVFEDGEIRTHEFYNLKRYDDTFGDNAQVDYELEISGETIVNTLEFPKRKTDNLNYYEFNIVQNKLETKIRRNISKKIDLFSSQDIDGNTITPLTPERILLKSTPLKQYSEWEQPTPININVIQNRRTYFALSQSLVRQEIEGSLVPNTDKFFNIINEPDTFNSGVNFPILLATDNLKNVVVDISNFTYDTNFITSGSLRAVWQINEVYDPADNTTISFPLSGTNVSQTINVGDINREQRLFLFFVVFADNSNGQTSTGTYSAIDIEITATSTDLDSVTECVRLIDAMRQVVFSISGATIDAPDFEDGGQLYDNYLMTGNQIRNINTRSFYISFEDVTKNLKEFFAGYEAQEDGTVFFGLRQRFYTDTNIATIDEVPKTIDYQEYNPEFNILGFNFEYKNFEKGSTRQQVENSREGIHGQAQYSIPNINSQTTEVIEIDWVRDHSLLTKTQRQVSLPDNTVQDNDDDIFIVEVSPLTSETTRTENLTLNHILGNNGVLILVNDGSFNWSTLGAVTNGTVSLSTSTGDNDGDYTIGTLGVSDIQLTPQAGTPNPTFEGLISTEVTYTISAVDKVSTTGEDFDIIDGTVATNGFVNMSFSIARNIRNFYGDYLATVCTFIPNESLVNTQYLYNKEFRSRKAGEIDAITEGDNIPVNELGLGILSKYISRQTVRVDRQTFINIRQGIRTQRGFLTLRNPYNEFYKTYPLDIDYNLSTEMMTILGEDKRE